MKLPFTNVKAITTRARIGWFLQLVVAPLAVLTVGLTVTHYIWLDAERNAHDDLERDFQYKAAEAVEALLQRMQIYEQSLHSTRALFVASQQVEREEFRQFIAEQKLDEKYPGVLAISFSPWVLSVGKDAHIASVRSEGFLQYTVFPLGERAGYAPVSMIEPFNELNHRAFGFDIYSESVRREALEQSRDANQAKISGKLKLVQDAGGEPKAAFLMMLPVYKNDLPYGSVDERRENLQGWVTAVFRVGDLLRGVLLRGQKEIDLEVYDGDTIAPDSLLYDDDHLPRAKNIVSPFRYIGRVEIAGRTWTLVINSLAAFDVRLDREKPRQIVWAGVVLSLLSTLVTWLLSCGRIMTLLNSQKIKKELNMRKQAEDELHFASLVLNNSSEAMVVTDSDNKIIVINPAFTEITGYNLGEIKGKDPAFLSSGVHDKSFYKEMWQQISTQGRWRGEIWDKRKSGEIYAKAISINAIKGDDGAIHRYVALFSDITEKKINEDMIWRQANFDSLTGFPNRIMFRDRLGQEIKKSDRAKLPLALFLIDLDRFKEVNDTQGHDVGDKLLQVAAARIASCVRGSDTVARLGGDEFTVILSALTDTAHIDDIAQKIEHQLSEPFHFDDHIFHLSASIGVTLYPNDADNIDDLMKNADQAMYSAKDMGRGRVRYFTQALQDAAQKRARLTRELRRALELHEFVIYFQPIADIKTGQLLKAEALLRWQHPQRGLLSPAEFISLSEDTGLIVELTNWLFRQVVDWLRKWEKQARGGLQISINVSPVLFKMDDASALSRWVAYLREVKVAGDSLVIEITESLLLHAETEVHAAFLALREAGVHVAIDDFGTGYSSLAYLKKFDIDFLKIDQSFVHNLGANADDQAITEAIIVMAHKLGLKVIAEGVETQRQRELLVEVGCDYGQGFLYAAPMPAAQFEKLMADSHSRILGHQVLGGALRP